MWYAVLGLSIVVVAIICVKADDWRGRGIKEARAPRKDASFLIIRVQLLVSCIGQVYHEDPIVDYQNFVELASQKSDRCFFTRDFLLFHVDITLSFI